MTRVYWSAVDARRRTVYRCRILPADDSSASKSCCEIKSNKNRAELSTDGVNRTPALSDTAAVAVNATSVTAARRITTPFSVSSDDFIRGRMDRFSSDKSDEVAGDSSTVKYCDEVSSAKAVNTTLSTSSKPYPQAVSDSYTTSCGAKNTVDFSDSSTQGTSSWGTGGVNTHTGCYKSTCDHGDCADAEAATNSSRRLFQPSVPAQECIQRRSFAGTAAFIVGDESDTSRDAAAETNVCTAGLRSDFDTHAQLKCVPLKLISQLDGAVPDSESEVSDEEADIPVSCGDVLSRSLVAPLSRSFAKHQGVIRGPLKCVKCKRVYRTEESFSLHSAVCTFEVSSSSESDRSECDGDWALNPSDQDTESCCSDDADDGVISEYLNSSRNSENMANCSSLGCQTENILVASEDCDVNANCKVLYQSNAKTGHFTLGTDSVTDGVENVVSDQVCDLCSESCTTKNTLGAAVVTCSASCVVEEKEIPSDSACRSVLDRAVQVDGAVGNKQHGEAEEMSDGQLPESISLKHENLACCSQADDSLDSQASCPLSVSGHDSVQFTGASTLRSQLCCGSANSRKDVPVASVDSDHVDPKAYKRNIANNKTLMGLSRAEFNAVHGIKLAGQQMSRPIDSSKTSDGKVEQFGSCVGTGACLRTFSSNADVPCRVTCSSSASVSSQQSAVKLQDILTPSASMVWPSATVCPSVVNNRSISSVTDHSGMCTRLLEAPWASLGALTTACVVVPSALPNTVAAACVRPHPVYAVGQGMIQSSRHGQPVQFLRPLLVTPMAWLAPQLAVMNAVHLRLPLTHRPAVTSACSSLYASSHQATSSVLAANIPSPSPQPVLSQCPANVPERNHFIRQKTVNNARFTAQVTSACSQSFRLPLVAATLLPAGYMKSVVRADLSSQQSIHHLVSTATVSPLTSAELPVAAVPPLSSTGINQLHTGHSLSSALSMHHVAAPSASSKYVASSGGMFFTWFTSTTPVTMSSQSSSTYGHKKSLSAGKSDFHAAVANIEADASVNIAPVVGNPSWPTQAVPRFNGLLRIRNVASAADCPDLMARRASSAVSLLVSSAGDTSLTSRPQCVASSSALLQAPSTVVIASCRSLSGCSPLNSMSIGTESTATKSLPVAGNSAKSPRLIMQPSFIAATTQPEASVNVVQSPRSTQLTSLTHLPPVNSRVRHLLTCSDALLHTDEVPPAEFSPPYSVFNKSLSTLSSPVNRSLQRIASSAECLSCPVEPQISSPPVSADLISSHGK